MRRVVAFTLMIVALFALPAYAAVTTSKQATNTERTLRDLKPLWKKTVSVDTKDTALDGMVGMLLKGTGINYAVDPDVGKLKVTATLKNVPAGTALGVILRSAGASCTLDNGILRISSNATLTRTSRGLAVYLAELKAQLASESISKSEQHPDIKALKAKIAEIESQIAEESEPRVQHGTGSAAEIVSLSYINAGDVLSLIQAAHIEGVDSVTATSGNRLLVTGDPTGIAMLKSLIDKLDDPSALPRPVRIKLSADITYRPDTGASVRRHIEADEVGAQNSPVSVGAYTDKGLRFGVQVTPKLPPPGAKDDSITLVMDDGILMYTMDGGSLNQGFGNVVTVMPGKAHTIASGTVPLRAGEADFEITITATIKPGYLRMPLSNR